MKIISKEGSVAAMSKRVTRTPSRRRKLQKSVLLLVEGSTERNIIPHCFDKRDYPDLSITIHDYNGGGYMEIEHWISRRRDTLDIVLVVCDLDRAASSKDEEKALRKTIEFLWNENRKNNIFLTCPAFEEWLLRGLPASPSSPLFRCLGYGSEKEQKSDTRLWDHFVRKGGTPAIAAAWFRNKPLYYKKVDFSQGQFDENHLTTSQSALYYLEDYLQLLNDK